jgi:hypothetical protein
MKEEVGKSGRTVKGDKMRSWIEDGERRNAGIKNKQQAQRRMKNGN